MTLLTPLMRGNKTTETGTKLTNNSEKEENIPVEETCTSKWEEEALEGMKKTVTELFGPEMSTIVLCEADCAVKGVGDLIRDRFLKHTRVVLSESISTYRTPSETIGSGNSGSGSSGGGGGGGGDEGTAASSATDEHLLFFLSSGAEKFLAAVLEGVAAELLELSGNVTMDLYMRDHKRFPDDPSSIMLIRPSHVCLAVELDEELNFLFQKHMEVACTP